MSTLELKQQIIASLQKVTDVNDMESVQKLIDELKVELYRDTIKPLTIEEYEARIQAGIDSVERGDFISFDDFEKEMDKW